MWHDNMVNGTTCLHGLWWGCWCDRWCGRALLMWQVYLVTWWCGKVIWLSNWWGDVACWCGSAWLANSVWGWIIHHLNRIKLNTLAQIAQDLNPPRQLDRGTSRPLWPGLSSLPTLGHTRSKLLLEPFPSQAKLVFGAESSQNWKTNLKKCLKIMSKKSKKISESSNFQYEDRELYF